MAFAQDKPAYIIYNKSGDRVSYQEMLVGVMNADVICFGELHNDPISHWLQLELTTDLFVMKTDQLVLGAEMFEADGQLLLDEYISGAITERNFLDQARLWPNYRTDYKPLVDFAKNNNLKFVATNIPRRYASVVFKRGLAALDNFSDEAKKLIAPLPVEIDFELPSYKALVSVDEDGQQDLNFASAQAIKDATMANFILKNITKKNTLLHFNGAYHSDHFEGIVWFLKKKKKKKKLQVKTITTTSQENISELNPDEIGKADFIICTPSRMCKTH